MTLHNKKRAPRRRKKLENVSENYKLLRTSWSVQTKLFFEQSTLHGVRYIAENGRPFIEKFMWFACVAIGAVATTVIILSLWEKFQTNPTITGLDTDFHNWDVPFPAITVCQETPSNLSHIEDYIASSEFIKNVPPEVAETFLTQLTKLSFDSIHNFVEYFERHNNTAIIAANTDLKELVFGLMNKCDEIFDTCEWKSYKYSCCEGFFPVFTESGFCYAFNSRHYERKVPGSDKELPPFHMQYIKETDIKWAMKFAVKDNEVNMPIYILNSDQEAGIDVQPQHIWDFKVDKISFSVKQTYTTRDTSQLSIKQRHCVFPNEIKLKIDHIYTYTACTRQCRMDNAMQLCNCVPHFYPQTGHYRHCKLERLKCIDKYLQEIKSVDRCSCHLGCDNTVYEVEKLLNEGNPGEAKKQLVAEFVSWPMVRYKREVLFGWVDLLGSNCSKNAINEAKLVLNLEEFVFNCFTVSFGGIAGLFLGFSLLSGVEILYYFTVRACCMAVRERTELERIQHLEASKPLPDYDLSLVPYFVHDPYPGSGLNEVAKGYYHENLRASLKNKIAPINQGKLKLSDNVLPPFGIEFMN